MLLSIGVPRSESAFLPKPTCDVAGLYVVQKIVAVVLPMGTAPWSGVWSTYNDQMTGCLESPAASELGLPATLIEGGGRGEGSAAVLAGFAVAIVSGAAFVVVEHRRREPMLPLALFRVPSFRSAAAIGVVINIAFYGLIFVLSLFFQRVQGMSPLRAGLAFAPMTVIVFAVNIFAGRHSSGRAARPLVVVGALCLAAGSLGLLDAGAHSRYPALVAQLVAIGGGIGLIVPIITAALLGSVPPGRAGVAAGTLNSARQSGSVIGVAVCGSLGAHGLVTGLHDSLVLCAAVAVVVAALAVGLRASE